MWERWGNQTLKHLKYSLNGLARFQFLPKFNFSTTLRQMFVNHLYHIIFMPPNLRNLHLPDFLGLCPRCMDLWQRGFSSHYSQRSSLQPPVYTAPKHGFGFATSILLESRTLFHLFLLSKSFPTLNSQLSLSCSEKLFLNSSAFCELLKYCYLFYLALLTFHLHRTLDPGVRGQALNSIFHGFCSCSKMVKRKKPGKNY